MRFCLIFISLLSGYVSAHQTDEKESVRKLKLRVMTCNLRFGELASIEELAMLIKAFKPDFVALQEVDCNTNRKRAPHQHNKNFINELAYYTGLFGLYGKTINYSGGYYGIGILSRYPYICVNKVLLPHLGDDYEQRAFLEGVFDVDGDTIVFASTHLDAKCEDTRLLQAKYICKHFEEIVHPVIIGGDFNADSESVVIKEMKNHWFADPNKEFSVPAWKPIRRIDFLFAKPQRGWKVLRSQAVQSQLSDHLPIVTDIEYEFPIP